MQSFGRHILQPRQAVVRDVLRRLGRHLHLTDVFLGEETLGADLIQPDGNDQRGQGRQQRNPAMAVNHPMQGAVVAFQRAVKQRFKATAPGGGFAGGFFGVFVFDKTRCQQRDQRQRGAGRGDDGQRHHHGKFVEQQAYGAGHKKRSG